MPVNRTEQPHYSWSQVSLWLRCPRRYYYQYIDRLPMRPVYALCSGKALHVGMEEHNRALVAGKRLPAKDIVEAGVAHLELDEAITELERPDWKDDFVREVTPPAGHYVAYTEAEQLGSEAPVELEDVEREIWFEVAGQPFLGYVDLVLPSRLLDYKFLGRRKSAQDVMFDGQLTLYRQVLGREAGFVQCIRKREVAEYTPQVQSEHVTRGVVAAVEDAVKSIEAAKVSGLFPRCDPKSWACSEAMCPFWRKCFSQVP